MKNILVAILTVVSVLVLIAVISVLVVSSQIQSPTEVSSIPVQVEGELTPFVPTSTPRPTSTTRPTPVIYPWRTNTPTPYRTPTRNPDCGVHIVCATPSATS